MKEVELHLAYAWDCDECGRENFERAIIAEFSPEEWDEMRAEGIDPRTGNWVTNPDEVTCRACGAVFKAARQEADQQ